MSSASSNDRIMGSSTTKISERMTWKQLQQCIRDKSDEFGQMLAQNFFLLQQQAKDKNDPISLATLEVIIASLMDLNKAIEDRRSSKVAAPEFSVAAFSLFSRLAESFNNPTLLKQVGLHFMTEWRLPEAAVRIFERALSLGGPQQSIRPLLDVAVIAVQRKASRNGVGANNGLTASPTGKKQSTITQAIRLTDKLLLTKTQKPSAPATLSIGKHIMAKPSVALPDPIKQCLKEAAHETSSGNLPAVHALLVKAGKFPVKKEVLCGMWSNLGRAWYLAGNSVEMENAYSQAYMHDPKGSNTYFNLALAKNMNHKVGEAEQLYQMAGKIDPNNPKVWCNLGVLYFQNDRFAEAEAAFRTAVERRVDYARAWDNLGSCLSAQGKTEEAIEACKQAIRYRPGYPEAYFKLSAIYLDKGDPASLTEAVSALSYVVKYAPLAASANAMLSVIQSRLEQIEPAKLSLQRAFKTDPNCPILPTVRHELEVASRAA